MPSLGDVEPLIALGAPTALPRGGRSPGRSPLRGGTQPRRVRVEIEWLIHLTSYAVVPGTRVLTGSEHAALRAIVTDFGPADIAALADIERVTVHDVKPSSTSSRSGSPLSPLTPPTRGWAS